MVNNGGIARGVKGKGRIEILRLHRLLEFERVFSDYLKGIGSAEQVAIRARKMLEIRLPRLK